MALTLSVHVDTTHINTGLDAHNAHQTYNFTIQVNNMDTVGHIRTLIQTQIQQRAIPINQPWVMRHNGVALINNNATVATVGLCTEDNIFVS